MKTIIFFIIINIFGSYVFSQNVLISGYVENSLSSEKIIGAIVRTNTNSVLTNDFGFYSIYVPKTDTVTLTISYIGFETQEINVVALSNNEINVKLVEQNEIDDVVVYSNKTIDRSLYSNRNYLSIKQLGLLPNLGGEKDLLKAIQLLPGVQTGNEGTNNLFVRGGNADENLIILDGIPLYNVNHIGGFISIFNPDAIKSAEIIKGAFPAKYGGRLSSVLNISLKNGNLNKFSGNFSVSPITSNISINGPIKKNKSSFIISVRSFYFGLVMRPYSYLSFSGSSFGYNFHDINLKLNYKFNRKNSLFLSFYEGRDKSLLKLNNHFISALELGHSDKNWGNTLFSIRLTHIFKPNLFSNFTLATTKYDYVNENNFYATDNSFDYLFNFKTQISNIILKSDFSWTVFKNFNIDFGTSHTFLVFTPGQTHFYYKSLNESIDTTYFYNDEQALENNFYLQADYKINNFITTNIGFRFSDYLLADKNYFFVEPRIILLFLTSKRTSIKASYAETEQNLHLISSSSASLPMDIWTTATSKIPPSTAKQFSVGFYYSIPKKNIEFSIEAYNKKSYNLVTFKEGTTYLSVVGSWVDKLEINGNGNATGVEFLIRKNDGKISGWLAYTWSKTTRQFENINSGKIYPFKYDRQHDFSFVCIYKISRKIILSANWVYGSGYPYTLPVSRYNINNEVVTGISIPSNQAIVYADRNSYRMRAYHRLDVATNFTKNVKLGIRTWTISIYNVYNRQNPYFYFSKYIDGKWQIFQQSLFPIIPSISYSLKF